MSLRSCVSGLSLLVVSVINCLLESVIIVNSDDSAFGTGWLISSKLKTNKETYPAATFIEDSKGRAAQAWNLAPKTATSLIVKADGEILFSKHGATTDEDIATVLTVLKAHLPVEAFQVEASLAQHQLQ